MRRTTIGILVVAIVVIIVVVIWVRTRTPKRDEIVTPQELVKIEDLEPEFRPLVEFNYDQKIPKVIMQTNEKKEIPLNMSKAVKGIRDANPEYQYEYYDDETAIAFLRSEFGPRYVQAYDDLIPGAYKADFFRYCYLLRKGGVYLDTGMVAVRPLREMIKATDEFISPEDDGCGGIYNAMMCSVPNHPILQKAVEQCLNNIESRFFGKNTLHITGPDMLSEAFETTVGSITNPNTDYGNGIRLVYHKSAKSKRSEKKEFRGEVFDSGKVYFYTKYEGYLQDSKWYHTNKHYSELWKTGKVYKN